jgi:two-component system, NtrC family, response regulator GlrR
VSLPREMSSDELSLEQIRSQCGSNVTLGESPALRDALCKLPRIAVHDVPVLLQGETGTGKEVIARTIHYLSPRRDRPFVPLPCGAIPVDLLENELFGHEAGAYTGALGAQEGLVARADGGTLFLDEVNTLPLLAQVKLLRFLQEGEYKPLGTACTRKADVRVVVACNCDLQAKVSEGSFREDLYYRVKGMTYVLPPLRERGGDILLLARHFLARYSRKTEPTLTGFSEAAERRMMSYSWPGNVRELENTIRCAVILADGDQIETCDLGLPAATMSQEQGKFKEVICNGDRGCGREHLERMLAMSGGNVTRASNAAGMQRRSFYRLMKKHGIDPAHYRGPENGVR